jgi:hypothetical protein
MSRIQPGNKGQPFPEVRPPISVRPSQAAPFTVELREVPGWYGVPEVGNVTLWCIYDPPNWRLTGATRMRGVRPAKVHGEGCVELGVDDWSPEEGWTTDTWMMFARLTDTASQWLATVRVQKGTRRLYTFLDEGFEQDWGEWPRHCGETYRLERLDDDAYRLEPPEEPVAADLVLGAGLHEVTVGERTFTCLRLFDVHPQADERSILFVAYATQEGRIVLGRRYNGPQWARHTGSPHAKLPPWDERFPEHHKIRINDVVFTHWYDSLGHVAFGIDPEEWR